MSFSPSLPSSSSSSSSWQVKLVRFTDHVALPTLVSKGGGGNLGASPGSDSKRDWGTSSASTLLSLPPWGTPLLIQVGCNAKYSTIRPAVLVLFCVSLISLTIFFVFLIGCRLRRKLCATALPTISWAANYEPMTSLYFCCCYFFALVMIVSVFTSYVHFRLKLDRLFATRNSSPSPSSPSSPVSFSSSLLSKHQERYLKLRVLNALSFWFGCASMLALIITASLPQGRTEPFHSIAAFSLLVLSFFWTSCTLPIYGVTAVTRLERSLFGFRILVAATTVLCAFGTTIEALFAYCCPSRWINPTMQAVFEILTVELAFIFYLPCALEFRNYQWAITRTPTLLLLSSG